MTETTHSFARKLLAQSDIPLFYFDPSLVDFETGDPDDGNVSVTAPVLEIVNLSDEEVDGDERAMRTFALICSEHEEAESAK